MRARHALWIVAAVLAGCRFDPSGLSAEPPDPERAPDAQGAPVPDARGEDAGTLPDAPDARPTPLPACDTRLRRWRAEFDRDPTDPAEVDEDGDGQPDWVMRDGSPFPAGALDQGVWRADPGKELDTRPLNDFDGVTVADVRMRNTAMAAPGEPDRGAVFWINADASGATMAALYLSLTLQADGTQDLALRGRVDGGPDQALLGREGLDGGFVEATLRVDAEADRVELWIGGTYQGSAAYPRVPTNDDRFATLLGDGSEAEFDRVRVEICAP